MPRKEVTLPDALEPSGPIHPITTLERHYKLITPLFGGGVIAGQNDPHMLIRPTSIRGHLRFWWRATRGSNKHVNDTLEALGLNLDGTPLEKLRRLESWIWGAAAQSATERDTPANRIAQSRVQISAIVVNQGEAIPCPNGLRYVGFPLQGQTIRKNVTFNLTVRFPASIASEIQASLWAWETFGGVGARTRRGFGALELTGANDNSAAIEITTPSSQTVLTLIQQAITRHVKIGTWEPDVPRLSHAITDYKFAVKETTSSAAWENLVGRLKNFRQQRVGTKRSHWPEPDVIRSLTNQAANYTDDQGRIHDHRTPRYENPPLLKMPRAQFGLPIQFEFKDQRTPRGQRDPRGKNMLAGVRQPNSNQRLHERLASPLILRPLACSDGYVGLACYIRNTRLPALEIDTEKGFHAVDATLTPDEAARILDNSQRQLLVKNDVTIYTNVIEAFLSTFPGVNQ